ncbi:MAG: Gfo/Idh/MocA family oxidoreductase [Phycisphaerales bacterium]|nr:Gfo/Idh/MocA family oxidoreductase [Phycisphaerales bacterium]
MPQDETRRTDACVTLPRRAFLAAMPLAVAALPAFSTRSFAVQETPLPARKARIALIGCAGRGGDNLGDLLGSGAEIVALCDVSKGALAAAAARGVQAPTFSDFRALIRRRNELQLDGVLVSTPDHTHAFATAMCLRAKLPVYCEKPLTHTVAEVRRLRELARIAQVPTQMGTQIHAENNYRRVVELIRGGAIGRITSCDCWVGKSWCCGTETPVAPPPADLDWDLWQGPIPHAPYVAELTPANWRKYWKYGTGTLGDMGCHIIDLPFWALGLDAANLGNVELFTEGSPIDTVGCPSWLEVSWAIPQANQDPLIVRWFDGGRISPTAQELGGKDKQDYHGRFNVLFQGTDGFLLANYGEYLILPPALVASRPAPSTVGSIANSVGHHREWLNAIVSTDSTRAQQPLCHFEKSTLLTEFVLAGTLAYRAGGRLSYDFRTGEAAGAANANALCTEAMREGWSLSDKDLDAAL